MAFKYAVRKGKRAKSRRGRSFVAKGKKPKLGSGGRFRVLKTALGRKGVRNPAAVAAFIGRKKYGAKRFARLGRQGRNKARRKGR